MDTSRAHGIVVSGSQDATAIVWDLKDHCYVRQLCGHSGAISSVSINHASGTIMTVSGPEIRIWTINGDVLAVANTNNVNVSDLCESIFFMVM